MTVRTPEHRQDTPRSKLRQTVSGRRQWRGRVSKAGDRPRCLSVRRSTQAVGQTCSAITRFMVRIDGHPDCRRTNRRHTVFSTGRAPVLADDVVEHLVIGLKWPRFYGDRSLDRPAPTLLRTVGSGGDRSGNRPRCRRRLSVALLAPEPFSRSTEHSSLIVPPMIGQFFGPLATAPA